MADVFISYSREDIQFAQRLHHALESRDREPWVDMVTHMGGTGKKSPNSPFQTNIP